MDDITISCDRIPGRIVWAIKQEIHRRGLNYHKERRYTRGIGEVTGGVVRDGKVVVPNRQRKKAYDIRAQLSRTTDPAEALRLASVLRGLDAQRRQIEGYC
jgi:hypothetical protein